MKLASYRRKMSPRAAQREQLGVLLMLAGLIAAGVVAAVMGAWPR